MTSIQPQPIIAHSARNKSAWAKKVSQKFLMDAMASRTACQSSGLKELAQELSLPLTSLEPLQLRQQESSICTLVKVLFNPELMQTSSSGIPKQKRQSLLRLIIRL